MKGDKPHLIKRDEFMENVAKTFKDGERFKFIAEQQFRKRSNPQNRYYFGIIIDCYLRGYEETEGRKLCTEIVNRKTGEILYIPMDLKEQQDTAHKFLKTMFNEGKSTTENSTEEQEIYHDFCREYIKFAFNLIVPMPDESLKLF
jgi:hypothetical protein